MLVPEAARIRHVAHRRGYIDNPKVRDMCEDLKLMGRRKNGTEFRVLVKLGPVVIPDGVTPSSSSAGRQSKVLIH
jgi:rsbT co-antagonist protein RsbR